MGVIVKLEHFTRCIRKCSSDVGIKTWVSLSGRAGDQEDMSGFVCGIRVMHYQACLDLRFWSLDRVILYRLLRLTKYPERIFLPSLTCPRDLLFRLTLLLIEEIQVAEMYNLIFVAQGDEI